MTEDDQPAPDLLLGFLEKQDLSDLSVGDLTARIGAMEAEITRCRGLITARDASRSAAENVFKT
ncbi:MAG: DUF1192 domain-containing protein [Pseudomonadota bacterium]